MRHLIFRSANLPTLALIVLVSTMPSGCARDPKAREAQFLERGKAHMVKKDYQRAALEFQNAVQVMPQDAEAHYQLGLAHRASGASSLAFASFTKATQLNPSHTEAQLKLAELMIGSRNRAMIQQGETRLENLLRASPDHVDALDALAVAELQLGKWQDAESHLQRALEKFPHRLKSSVALAKMHVARRDFKAAEEVLKKASDGSAQAEVALGDLYLLQSDSARAEERFRKALKADPKSGTAMLGLALAQISQGHRDQAEETYRAIAALPDKQYKHLHAAFLLADGKQEPAIRELEKLAKEDPRDRDARTRLVAAYLASNRVADATAILTAALKANPNDTDALLQRSEISLRAGNQGEAESDLVRVLHQRADSAPAHFLLGRIFQLRGDALRQRAELSEALRLSPTFLEARVELARHFNASGLPKTALELVNAAPGGQKKNGAIIVQRNWALLYTGDFPAAAQGIRDALKLSRAPEFLLQDAAWKLSQKDYSGVRASASEVLKKNPQELRALLLLALSYREQKQPETALRTIKEHAAQNPKSAPVQHFLGEWLMASNSPAEARAAFMAAKAADPGFAPAVMQLARLDISEGKLDSARPVLTGMLASDDAKGVLARLLLGKVDIQSGNRAAALDRYRKVLETDRQNIVALNNLAYLLADFANQPDEALTYAQRAVELAPENADTGGTLGWVFYRKGLYPNALKYLQAAVARDGQASTENAAIRKYHLAMTYWKLGDQKRAVETLLSALKTNPKLSEAQMARELLGQTASSLN